MTDIEPNKTPKHAYINTFTASAGFLISLLALYQSYIAISRQEASNNPYFKIEGAQIIDLDDGKPKPHDDFSLKLDLKNIGKRTAANFFYQLYFLNEEGNMVRERYGQYLNFVNDIPTDKALPIEIIFGINNIAGGIQQKQLLAFVFGYEDRVSGKCIMQDPLFFIWPSVTNTELFLDLLSTDKDYRQKVLKTLEDNPSFASRNCG